MPDPIVVTETATLFGGLYAIHGLRRWADHVTLALAGVAAVLLATLLILAAPDPDPGQHADVYDPAFGVFAQPE